MTLNASIGRRLLLAGNIAAIVAGWPAVAQQPAPQPAAPAAAAPTGPAAAPPWAQGRPEAAIGVPLAPIAPPPIPTAADKLPIEKLKAPKGFKIELYAAGVGNARTIRQGDKGTVFVGSRLLDKVYAIVEKTANARSRQSTRDFIGRTAWPSRMARCISRSSPESRRSKKSRTTSTTRRSRSLSTRIC